MNRKEIEELSQKFSIKLPQDADANDLSVADIKLLNFWDDISYGLQLSELELAKAEHAFQKKKLEAYTEIIKDFRDKQEKIPAAATLETMATGATQEEKAALAKAQVARKTWQILIQNLTEKRKLIDQLGYLQHAIKTGQGKEF